MSLTISSSQSGHSKPMRAADASKAAEPDQPSIEAGLHQFNGDVIDAAECYRSAAQKAADYFESLHRQIVHKTYARTLTRDIRSWKHSHVRHTPLLSRWFGRNHKPDPQDYGQYIQWLYRTGKLDNYLDRSVSYIFMRDLGKALDSPDAQARVRRVVDILKDYLTRLVVSDGADRTRDDKHGRVVPEGGERRH